MDINQIRTQLAPQIAQANGVPPNVLDSVITHESGWNPNAVSPVGALGLGQLMPGTAQTLGVNPHDPVQNLTGAAKFLGGLIRKYNGNIPFALAAYNAGPGAVAKYGGIPPYKETQNYVSSIMSSLKGGAIQSQPMQPAPGPNGASASRPSLQQLVDSAAPTDTTVSILQRLGGTAGSVAQAAQAPVSLPATWGGSDKPVPGGGDQSKPQTYKPMLPITHALDGSLPMVLGGNNIFPNIKFAGHVDYQHVNPRLLMAVQKEAEKRGVIANVISGYRSNDYSSTVGGFKGDPHTKGLAIDAYINGHPIGEVVSPQEWARYGVRSGNAPGFFHGKADPEHLDLVGIPLKGARKA